MAGIEQLEIHSKSYIVRWVKVEEGNTISWSVQPHKKSINFGIVKHPGSGATSLSSTYADDSSPALTESQVDGAPDPSTTTAKGGSSIPFIKKEVTAQDQLVKKGFIPIKWHGKCEADKVSMGTYDVGVGKGGMFGLVFDNTFSKQTGKTATFVLLTYPTSAPPQAAHLLPNLQAAPGSGPNASRTSFGKHGGNSPRLGAVGASESVDSLHSHRAGGRAASIAGRSDPGTSASSYYVGTLLKRRRKKGQGYARRFFSLDYTTCTLSYYHNRNSSALRGAIPLSLAAIAADERRREISIDSGAEIWHLRASSVKDFNDWAKALEKASRIALGLESLPGEAGRTSSSQGPSSTADAQATPQPPPPPNTAQEADRDWQQVEALVSRIVGTRDALRRLVKDMTAQQRPGPHLHSPFPSFLSPPAPTLPEHGDGYFPPQQEKRPFWKRKSSASPLVPQENDGKVQSPSSTPSAGVTTTITSNGSVRSRKNSKGKGKAAVPEERTTHDHCTALLSDLDSVVVEFSAVLARSKRRRLPLPEMASRKSYESTSTTDEFFDAEAGDLDRSQLLRIDQDGEDMPSSEADEMEIHDSSSVSSVEEDDEVFSTAGDAATSLYPSKPKSLTPLPITATVSRRTTIPQATIPPPSLIAFVRKNVGKDLATISMPVSANEPTSLLQRVAEQLEYADLLDRAASTESPRERLLLVAAFAVSQFSNGRCKERAIRKPFNPLLGETFELVRGDAEKPGGFRALVEKVSHRPVRLALQADAAHWSLAQSPAPTQKFWGKSAELTTEGRVRLVLRVTAGQGGGETTEERYSWALATVFLRNVVMGEKYVEPVGSMAVANESTGARAVVEFKSKGMFGGRSEDVVVEAYGPDGGHWGAGLTGTWTGGLRLADSSASGAKANAAVAGEEVWRPGKLVENAAQTYGMTLFAASLNEITPIEEGRLAPTDTRLRPDQRLAEQGKLDEAEEWKIKLEEAQRRRRRVMEENGEEHRPRWFVKAGVGADGVEEVWKLRSGKEGYWEEREKTKDGKAWSPGVDLFAA